MSTRSVIVVTGKNKYGQSETIRLYKHSDGYPTGVLPIIQEAIKAVQKTVLDESNICRKGDDVFKTFAAVRNHTPEKFESVYSMTSQHLAGKLIGLGSDCYGMGIQLEESFKDAFHARHLGSQSDLEWMYVVDLEAMTCEVYGGGYTGNSPAYDMRKGFVDPASYADKLIESCQARERLAIKAACDGIKRLGFSINSDVPKKRRTAVKA